MYPHLQRLCFGLTLLVGSVVSQAQPLSVKASLSILTLDPTLSPITLSPDGEWMAVGVHHPQETMVREYDLQGFTATGYPLATGLAIFRTRLQNLRTGEVINLNSGQGIDWSGRWSPDSRSYAFYSDRDGSASLWIWDLATRSARQVPGTRTRNFRDIMRPCWTPDGRSVVCALLPEGTTFEDMERINIHYAGRDARPRQPDPLRVGVRVYRAEDKAASNTWAYDHRYLADLAVIEVQSGHITRLTQKTRPLRFEISPDGKWVAAMTVGPPPAGTMELPSMLAVYSLNGAVSRILDSNVVSSDPLDFSWAPDSRQIAYFTYENTLPDRKAGWRVYATEIESGRKTLLSRLIAEPLPIRVPPLWNDAGTKLYVVNCDEPRDFSRLASNLRNGRLWEFNADGSGGRQIGDPGSLGVESIVSVPGVNRLWSPDGGESLLISTLNYSTKQIAYRRVDILSGRSTLLQAMDAECHGNPVGVAADPTRFFFFRETVGEPTEVWTLSVNERKIERVTELNPDLRKVAQGESRLVEWRSTHGQLLRGALLLPPGRVDGMRCPLVVSVYGGANGSNSLHVYAMGGGQPASNWQLLATRGYAVLVPDIPVRPRNIMADVSSAVLPALNKMIELGYADPDRLVVTGQSFGGYNTFGLITQTDRFAAAIASNSGAAELFEGYARFSGGTGNSGYYEQGQGGMRGTPWEIPEVYIQNSPFFFLDRVKTPLLIQRGANDPISAGNGLVFNALKRLGRDVEFLEYENEGHMLQMPANVADFWDRRFRFLADKLDLALDADGAIIYDGVSARGRKPKPLVDEIR